MILAGVKFEENKKTYYFNAGDVQDCENKNVIVETDKGLQFGHCVSLNEVFNDKKSYKNVVRLATKKDFDRYEKNIIDNVKALDECKKVSDELGLVMEVICASYTYDRKKLIFTFVSEDRVDFRELVKRLAGIFHTRIEMKQIGIRDEAKKIGGIGPCGRELCCKAFLNEFDSVSINMAKTQNLSLNPNKISGCCGRLMCCLKYENEVYKDARKHFPKIGSKVKTEFGTGKVVSHLILERKYVVSIEGHENIVMDLSKDKKE